MNEPMSRLSFAIGVIRLLAITTLRLPVIIWLIPHYIRWLDGMPRTGYGK
jgi:hypothetical protein